MAQLDVKPLQWTFPKQGGLSHFTFQSGVNKRLGFKNTVSNPTIFKVKPENGFIEPNGKVAVEVTRIAGPAGANDELVVQWAEVDATVRDPRDISKSPLLAEIGLPLKTA